MFYNGNDGSTIYVCYATSTDGLSWTRPNLGLVSYGGNTNNNILFPGVFTAALYDDVESQWVIVTEDTDEGAGNEGVRIYTSATPDGGFSLAKHLDTVEYSEGKEVVRRADGTWVAYYVNGHATQRRSLNAWVSDTPDLDGAWSNQGSIGLTSVAATRQFYAIGVERFGSHYYGLVQVYNQSTEKITPELHISTDGLNWHVASASWLPLGSGGSFDDEMVLHGAVIAEDGTDWHLYYSGFPANHAASLPRDSRVGRATVPAQRVGQVAGTGNLTTLPIEPDGGSVLTVNSSAGTVEVEVLDATTLVPVTGFARANFDDITGDSRTHACTWGGTPMPTGAEIRLKFYLTAATVHGYTVT